MYAIIETDGKQYRVKEGDLLRCDAVSLEPGSSISFDRVVLASAGGSAVTIGKPHVAGASVSGSPCAELADSPRGAADQKPPPSRSATRTRFALLPCSGRVRR